MVVHRQIRFLKARQRDSIVVPIACAAIWGVILKHRRSWSSSRTKNKGIQSSNFLAMFSTWIWVEVLLEHNQCSSILHFHIALAGNTPSLNKWTYEFSENACSLWILTNWISDYLDAIFYWWTWRLECRSKKYRRQKYQWKRKLAQEWRHFYDSWILCHFLDSGNLTTEQVRSYHLF